MQSEINNDGVCDSDNKGKREVAKKIHIYI